MGNFLRVIKTTLAGGIFFLVPFVLLIVIFEKAFKFVNAIIGPILKDFPGTYIHRQGVKELIVILLIIIICFLIGLFASTPFAKKIIQKIEGSVLSLVPGYSFMKNMSESIVGVDSGKNFPVVMVKANDGWQLAFLIEEFNSDVYTVFIPDAPSPWSGSVLYIEKKNVRKLKISQKQALEFIKKLGAGSAAVLSDVILDD